MANPYLNMPPTKLKRDIQNEDDPDKRKQMRDALNAWRLTVPGPFRKGEEMNRQAVKRELVIAGNVKYNLQSGSGGKAHIVITGISNPDPDDIEGTWPAITALLEALKKNRRAIQGVGFGKTGKSVFTKYTVVVPIEFSGVFEEAEPVMDKVLSRIRVKTAKNDIRKIANGLVSIANELQHIGRMRKASPSWITVVAKVMDKQMGFILDGDVPALKKQFPNMAVLVRCGNSRYIAPIRDLDEVFNMVEQEGDYVRDVSIPAKSFDQFEDGRGFVMVSSITKR